MEFIWDDCVVHNGVLYMCIQFLYSLSIKPTLSACVWRWSCARYTWADDLDVGGAGES